MKKIYQKPSMKVIHTVIQHHLLQASGQVQGDFGSPATKPAKSRNMRGWDDDWDEDDY